MLSRPRCFTGRVCLDQAGRYSSPSCASGLAVGSKAPGGPIRMRLNSHITVVSFFTRIARQRKSNLTFGGFGLPREARGVGETPGLAAGRGFVCRMPLPRRARLVAFGCCGEARRGKLAFGAGPVITYPRSLCRSSQRQTSQHPFRIRTLPAAEIHSISHPFTRFGRLSWADPRSREAGGGFAGSL